jgi:hypothetical protein
MQAALDAFVAGLTPGQRAILDRVALTVVAIDHPHTGAWAGRRNDEVHYSASLLKVAAMYAAFDLRSAAATLFADHSTESWPEFRERLVAEFNSQIISRTSSVITATPGMKPHHIVPNYDELFQPTTTAAGPTIGFTPSYRAHIEGMIPGGHNNDAAACIHGLGYGFINAKLADDGFFDTPTSNGIWLAGDFMGQRPAARITSINDGDVAQALTTRQLAKLLTLMVRRSLLGSDEMLDLLGRTGSWFEFTNPHVWPAGGNFARQGAKVGRGPLKTGGEVLSEGILIHEKAHETRFVAAWQNVMGAPTLTNLRLIADVIESTINGAFNP